ncbi:MAG: cation:proton antiporter subunit C [Gammaproteobacteria bacterium]|nr:cation:proton antiporter subunit C [Gammaproteobacteria bacterium]
MSFPGLLNYWVALILLVCGLIIVMDSRNLVKKLVGLGIFQSAVFLVFITLGKKSDGNAPILDASVSVYSNPLPHVLILTAIVVGVATTAVGLALVARIRRAYGTIDEDEIDDRPEVEPEIVP